MPSRSAILLQASTWAIGALSVAPTVITQGTMQPGKRPKKRCWPGGNSPVRKARCRKVVIGESPMPRKGRRSRTLVLPAQWRYPLEKGENHVEAQARQPQGRRPALATRRHWPRRGGVVDNARQSRCPHLFPHCRGLTRYRSGV